VWGKKEDSSLFTLIPKILEEFNIVETKARSSWHMGERDPTIKMMEDTGFVNVLAWYQFVPWKPMSLEETMEYTVPFIRGRISEEYEE
jgi:hypothetical protein